MTNNNKSSFSASEELIIDQIYKEFMDAHLEVTNKYGIDNFDPNNKQMVLLFLAQVKFTDKLNEFNAKADKMIDKVIKDTKKYQRNNK